MSSKNRHDSSDHKAAADVKNGKEMKVSRVPAWLLPFVNLDKYLSAQLALCASSHPSYVSWRSTMKLLEISCHGVPWLAGCLGFLYTLRGAWAQELLVNTFVALIIDIILVGILKAIFRRGRPSQNTPDMFATLSVDNYAFPSGHASRAIMLFLMFFYTCELSPILCFLLATWSVVVCFSRVLLGRHHIGDILGGTILGIFEYELMTFLWMSPKTAHNLLWLLYDDDTSDADG